jgi:hypothetical protein
VVRVKLVTRGVEILVTRDVAEARVTRGTEILVTMDVAEVRVTGGTEILVTEGVEKPNLSFSKKRRFVSVPKPIPNA